MRKGFAVLCMAHPTSDVVRADEGSESEWHWSEADAYREAEHAARMNPGQRFGVVEIKGWVEVPKKEGE